MINELLRDITGYISYLYSEHCLGVTVHDCTGILTPFMHELIRFNTHSNPYCIYLKTSDALWERCVESQKKVYKRCARCVSEGESRFYGMCHAGVREYVYPVAPDGDVKCFISVSGYREGDVPPRVDATAREYGLDRETARRIYMESLSPEKPSEALLGAVLPPLVHMLELLIIEGGRQLQSAADASNSYYTYYVLLNELNRRLGDRITLAALSRRFNCSESYLSHLFKRYSGMSINRYINDLRLKKARTLLETTNLSVQDIALTVGFCDANYFSDVFRRSCGAPPTEYRASCKRDGGEAVK